MEAHCLETGYDYSKIIPTLKHHCTNGRLINRLEDRPPSQFTRSFLSIKEKLKRDGLIMAKADKGEALVLMTKDQYEQKLLDFLHQAGASPMDYKFSIHNESIRGKIRKAQFLITGPQKSRKRFYVMNPAFPKIYGQVKTHKSGYPIRPVVAFFTDPSFHLAKFLTEWFRTTSKFEELL